MPESSTNEKPAMRAGLSKQFIDKWALLYCNKLVKEGKDKAIAWGIEFFNKDDVDMIAKRAKEILKGRGLQ